MQRLISNLVPKEWQSKRKNYYTYSEARPIGEKVERVKFRIHFTKGDVVLDGRVILYFGTSESVEPRFQSGSIAKPMPCFAQDVTNMKPNDVVEFDSRTYSLPDALAFVPQQLSIDPDHCYVQALINRDISDPDPNTCKGNNFSKPLQFKLSREHAQSTCVVIDILADQLIAPLVNLHVQHNSQDWLECVSLTSQVLSQYHNRSIDIFAAVILPKDYHTDTTRVYPAMYYVEGFAGTESYIERADEFLDSEMGQKWKAGDCPLRMIRVVLGSRFTYGHTSFADGEVNGPWATALTEEFVPFLDSKFRIDPNGRFLMGHSSGGWSSLWLQIQYPMFFHGTWSSGPDPVDFTQFQLTNIYDSHNMYWDSCGRPIPTARTNGVIDGSVRDENLYERVVGRGNGGQWDAFFAVFGPKREDGTPEPLFDKVTGEINPDIAVYWKRFDICLYLRQNPAVLESLQGKLHVICGLEDNYYLDRACWILKGILEKESASGNYVKFVSGDHSTFKTCEFYTTVFQEMAEIYNE